MTSQRPDPLTPEERELADRLARIGPYGMPSPALDARILGAAQAAIARGATPARRRWPAWVGVAATLALALGAVWQLRPAREMPVALDEAPSSAVMHRPPAAVEEMRPAAATPPKPRELAAPPASPAPPPPVVFHAPSPVDVPAPLAAPAPPAPPPLPHAEKAQSAPATDPMQRHRSELQDTVMARRSMAAAESAMESATSATPADEASTDAIVTVTDLPVASDRLLPPVDWLERIRQRREAGDFASARASLALFRQDHPQLPLPEDVLTIPAPAPPPDR